MYEIIFMTTDKLRSRRKIEHVWTRSGRFVIDLSTAAYATQKVVQIWPPFIRDAGRIANRTAVLWTARQEICKIQLILRRGITSINFDI